VPSRHTGGTSDTSTAWFGDLATQIPCHPVSFCTMRRMSETYQSKQERRQRLPEVLPAEWPGLSEYVDGRKSISNFMSIRCTQRDILVLGTSQYGGMLLAANKHSILSPTFPTPRGTPH
jgi:hypothetical protein